MNCVLRCVDEDDCEFYVLSKAISDFTIIIDEGDYDNDPVVEKVVINPFSGHGYYSGYYCKAIELFRNGISVGEMDFDSNESWRKSEVLKMLMECFK